MEKIPSFQKDHNKIEPGFFLSMTDGDITTYDLRFVKPNSGGYLSNAAIHSIEHMLATALRNGRYKEYIIYFGPMGCRTGFYLLTRNLGFYETKKTLIEAIEAGLEMSEVPGAAESECGNYREHSLSEAKQRLREYYEILRG